MGPCFEPCPLWASPVDNTSCLGIRRPWAQLQRMRSQTPANPRAKPKPIFSQAQAHPKPTPGQTPTQPKGNLSPSRSQPLPHTTRGDTKPCFEPCHLWVSSVDNTSFLGVTRSWAQFPGKRSQTSATPKPSQNQFSAKPKPTPSQPQANLNPTQRKP